MEPLTVWLALEPLAVRPEVVAPLLLAAWPEVIMPEPLAVHGGFRCTIRSVPWRWLADHSRTAFARSTNISTVGTVGDLTAVTRK